MNNYKGILYDNSLSIKPHIFTYGNFYTRCFPDYSWQDEYFDDGYGTYIAIGRGKSDWIVVCGSYGSCERNRITRALEFFGGTEDELKEIIDELLERAINTTNPKKVLEERYHPSYFEKFKFDF